MESTYNDIPTRLSQGFHVYNIYLLSSSRLCICIRSCMDWEFQNWLVAGLDVQQCDSQGRSPTSRGTLPGGTVTFRVACVLMRRNPGVHKIVAVSLVIETLVNESF